MFGITTSYGMKSWLKENLLLISWVVALVSMMGSLFFSNVLHFPPCVLCWYQRIFMYPLVLILGVGILRKDRNVAYYVLPLSVIGGVIALYHNLLYYNFIPESLAPCLTGVSCTTKFIEYFGFVTIPFLSLMSFVVITTCMILYKKSNKS